MSSEVQQKHAPGARPERHFLLLQMPCGAFGRSLQRSLKEQGLRCSRVAINGGDLMDGLLGRPIVYRRSFADWPSWLSEFASRENVTDLVIYGDCRPYHRAAAQALKPLGITVHVLEEGYLRPNWVTCENDGVNGNSALARIDLDRIELQPRREAPEVKLHGTNLRYAFAGFNYYFWTMLLQILFPRYESHRDLDVVGEATLWLQRLASWPLRRSRTERSLRTIGRLNKPVHLVLLQLNGDSQIKVHSNFESTRHFVEYCIAEFAASGVQEAVLVFKNHPLDSGVINLNRVISEVAAEHGLEGRVFFVETGKLVPLLEKSVSATAINSTACHQALLRGIPTMVLGKAVFNHPQIVARMRLADFFRARPCKSKADYEKLIGVMRRTCQFNGGFYSNEGREILLPSLIAALIEGSLSPQSFEIPANFEKTTKQAS
jgi:capsular polysaccharide export protein